MPVSRPKKPRRRAASATTKRAAKARERARKQLLWGDDAESRRGRKRALNAADIAIAATEIADAEGLSAVSMGRVAERLGFTPMALYRHVPGKDAMVDLMFDAAMGSPPSHDCVDGGWRPKIEQWALAMWLLLL